MSASEDGHCSAIQNTGTNLHTTQHLIQQHHNLMFVDISSRMIVPVTIGRTLSLCMLGRVAVPSFLSVVS